MVTVMVATKPLPLMVSVKGLFLYHYHKVVPRGSEVVRSRQCAPFDRRLCRAALARLPQVAMSHQRRLPFFVLS